MWDKTTYTKLTEQKIARTKYVDNYVILMKKSKKNVIYGKKCSRKCFQKKGWNIQANEW